jgi:hypothetical protein
MLLKFEKQKIGPTRWRWNLPTMLEANFWILVDTRLYTSKYWYLRLKNTILRASRNTEIVKGKLHQRDASCFSFY